MVSKINVSNRFDVTNMKELCPVQLCMTEQYRVKSGTALFLCIQYTRLE